jgi:hypothetical protein
LRKNAQVPRIEAKEFSRVARFDGLLPIPRPAEWPAMYLAVRFQSSRAEASPVESLRARRTLRIAQNQLSYRKVPDRGTSKRSENGPIVAATVRKRKCSRGCAHFPVGGNPRSVVRASRTNLELNPQCNHPEE